MSFVLSAKDCVSSDGIAVDDMLKLLSNRIEYNRYENPIHIHLGFAKKTLAAGEYDDQTYLSFQASAITKYDKHPQNVLSIDDNGNLIFYDNYEYLFDLSFQMYTIMTAAALAEAGNDGTFDMYFRYGQLDDDNMWSEKLSYGRERIVLPTFRTANNYLDYRVCTYGSAALLTTDKPIAPQIYFSKAAYISHTIDRIRANVIAIPLELE